jgi:F-type H+-transporting ATPase subunit a
LHTKVFDSSICAAYIKSKGITSMESFQRYLANVWAKFRAWIDANPRRAIIWGAAILIFLIGLFVPVPPPHVALSGEPLFSDGPSWLTNSLVTTLIVDVIIIVLAILATARMSLVPGGLQNLMEMLVEALYNLSESVAGDRARHFFPFVATIFILVLVCNWFGLIPGVGSIGYTHAAEHAMRQTDDRFLNFDAQLAMADGKLILVEPVVDELGPVAQATTPEAEGEHAQEGEGVVEGEEAAEGEAGEEAHEVFVPLFRAPSADLNMTFALAIATVVMIQYWGIRTQGGAYFKKFWNTSGKGFTKGINIFVGVLELISELARILAFGFRLFGNIFAGEVVLATMAFLVPFLLPLPFYALEVGVGAIQAFVFMMLALVFFTMATISHGHEEHEEAHGHAESHAHVDEAVTPAPVAAEAGH